MKATTLYEKQLSYLQLKLKVSQEYILETCKLSRVSVDKIVEYLRQKDKYISRFPVRV